ncbi:UDP-glucose 4-epimerase GalE [Mycoplasmopsis lipofaciens]|uniref:UDP-glucose 4-epimerase GalE n=1 Tax=Mycoplasmopsis lipofaciens TaxID=114884 RepID=UPI000488FEA8|nr:UDP-glucose 4-epimerase GalE [Mycoplasmopsis lipofaciens]
MKYLLVGGAGYIGSHIAEILNDNKQEVAIYDNLSTGFKEFVLENQQLYIGDVLNQNDYEKVLKNFNPDVVIYLAGLIKVGESIKFPIKYYETNILGIINTLKLMEKYKIKNLIFSSSAAVYGKNCRHKNGFLEKDTKKPISPYGKSKLFDEQIIDDYAKVHKDFNYTFLRYFNVAGASESQRIGYLIKNNSEITHIVPAISYHVFGKNPNFKINGNDYKTHDKTCIRDYIHVKDLANIHYQAAKHMIKNRKNYIYNVGNNKGYSNLEIVKKFEFILKRKLDIKYGPRREGDPDILIANSSKLKEELNYEFKYSLEDIVRTELEFRKNHQ